jgi:hypothetical protein
MGLMMIRVRATTRSGQLGDFDIDPFARTCPSGSDESSESGNCFSVFPNETPRHCGVAGDVDNAPTRIELLTLKLKGIRVSRQNL